MDVNDGSESEEPIARNPGLSSKSSNRFDASKCDGPGSALAAGKKRQEIRIQVEKDVTTEQSLLSTSDSPTLRSAHTRMQVRDGPYTMDYGSNPIQWLR